MLAAQVASWVLQVSMLFAAGHGELPSVAAAEDFGEVHLVGIGRHDQELAGHAGPQPSPALVTHQ